MTDTLKATRPGYGPEDELGYRKYRCKRCGGVRLHNAGRDKPEYCQDCVPYAVADGWMAAPEPRKRRSKA